MSNLLPKVVIAGLGAAVSPVAVILLITVLFREHARRNSLLFLAGFTLVLVAIGVVCMTLMDTAGSGRTGCLDAYLDVALGALCLALIPVAVRKKPKPRQEAGAGDLGSFGAFSRGMLAMLVNYSTMVIYIAGVHEISGADVSIAGTVLAMAVLTAVTLLTLLVPIAVYFIWPRRAQRALGSMRTWLLGHSKIIGVALLAVFAAYFLAKGIIKLA
jgi:hypothetical protein